MLKAHGMEKINFSGGEPFLHKKKLGQLVRYCKEELQLDSVSIVSNGSLIDRKWMEEFGPYLDILAISCDSFDAEVLRSFGRCTKSGKTDHISQTKQVRDWCVEFQVVFKMNTVVNAKNVHEDMIEFVRLLEPKRWKVFQALLLEGENVGENVTSRDSSGLTISDDAFQAYIERHRADPTVAKVIVPESNVQMKDSYLILDEYMRLLNCTAGGKIPGRSIFEAGVAGALDEAGHDSAMFYERGGEYEWRKANILDVEDMAGASSNIAPSLLPPSLQRHGSAGGA
jgi:radical S-adenosyl methionine domain-containing protein 2